MSFPFCLTLDAFFLIGKGYEKKVAFKSSDCWSIGMGAYQKSKYVN